MFIKNLEKSYLSLKKTIKKEVPIGSFTGSKRGKTFLLTSVDESFEIFFEEIQSTIQYHHKIKDTTFIGEYSHESDGNESIGAAIHLESNGDLLTIDLDEAEIKIVFYKMPIEHQIKKIGFLIKSFFQISKAVSLNLKDVDKNFQYINQEIEGRVKKTLPLLYQAIKKITTLPIKTQQQLNNLIAELKENTVNKPHKKYAQYIIPNQLLPQLKEETVSSQSTKELFHHSEKFISPEELTTTLIELINFGESSTTRLLFDEINKLKKELSLELITKEPILI